ncbi:HD family hydrolase [uncultured Sulfitobacter sp.]|uniref:HD domain-containing protein n=1 Tax=uncultured Sulfitobacter sp. TaxID=191468 RepID=UPI00260D59CE|nr:HD domain-containing protein [uncultured Sulfitobacter sp.]
MTERLEQQIAFLNEADKLKHILRGTTLCDASRAENSAEHSWHLTLYALVLADQAGAHVDITRVIKMLILHDLVEIDAGDNPIFGSYDADAMEKAEQIAADRIFGLLPNDLRDDLRATWEEFEAAQSPDAKFAKSLDRFQPPMQNLQSGGGSWTDYNVSEEMVAARVGSKIAIGAPGLWAFAREKIATFFSTQAKD